MPKGGTLRLGIAVAENGIRAEIADTGPGIPPEIRDKILEPFFTTKGIGGTGLGLSISSEIIARHGGKFSFESVRDGPSSGTCFQFFLPYQPAEAIFHQR
jgi:signal transduction histidine kinase